MRQKFDQKLWIVASKLSAVASLIKNQDGEPLASNRDQLDPYYGLALILFDLCRELDEIRAGEGNK